MRLFFSVQKFIIFGLVGSLISSFCRDFSVLAANRIEFQFEEMSIPVAIKDLDDWTKNSKKINSELATWLNLLDLETKITLIKFLKEPFLLDRTASVHLLRSWFGRQLFIEVAKLIKLDDKESDIKIFRSMERLLLSSEKITFLNLLRSLPGDVIYVDFDGLIRVASLLKKELKKQQDLVANLNNLSEKTNQINIDSKFIGTRVNKYKKISVNVDHRNDPLMITFWHPPNNKFNRENLIIFMPGLGSDQSHFNWLFRELNYKGWSVLAMHHPGSDSKSIKDLLDGKLPAPGLEIVPDRVRDVNSILNLIKEKKLDLNAESIILMGHSLGSLTAFLVSGAVPQNDIQKSCQGIFADFSLTNLSKLLQCQFDNFNLPNEVESENISAIIGLNSFGSILWPHKSSKSTDVPVLLIGGTFDFVTPAITEQLSLLLSTKENKFSSVLLIEGASHFSSIRVKKKYRNNEGDDIFKINNTFIGKDPLTIQKIISTNIIYFLNSFENNKDLPERVKNVSNNVRYHILKRDTINQLVN